MFRKKRNTLAQNKALYTHKENMKMITSPERVQKQVEKTKRYEAKMRKRGQAAAVKSISRNSAVATTTTSSALSEAEQSKNDAAAIKAREEAKLYKNLITGNMFGDNAVDQSKDGSKPKVGKEEDTNTSQFGFSNW